MLLIIILVVLLLAGGGGFYGRRAGWGQRGWVGLAVMVLVAILVLWLLNELLLPPLPMPKGTPSIVQ